MPFKEELRQLVDMGWRVHWWREREDHRPGPIKDVFHMLLLEPGGAGHHGKGAGHDSAFADAMDQYREVAIPPYKVEGES